MELQDILAEVGEEKAAIITAAIQAEKDRGIADSKRSNRENTTLKADFAAFKAKVKALEIDPDGDLDAQITALKEKLSKAGTGDGKDNDAVAALRKEMQKQIAAMQKTIDDEKAEKEAVSTKYRNSKISDILSTAMGESIIGKQYVIKDLIREGKVKLTDDNTVVFLENDEEIELPKGIEALKKNSPDIVRNVQSPGSGGGNGGTKTIKNSAGKEIMKRADWDALQKSNPRAAAKFALEGEIQD